MYASKTNVNHMTNGKFMIFFADGTIEEIAFCRVIVVSRKNNYCKKNVANLVALDYRILPPLHI